MKERAIPSPVVLFVTSTAIWGSTWFAIKFQLGQVAPELSVAYRFAFAALLLAAWCLSTRRSLRFRVRTHAFLVLQGVLMCVTQLEQGRHEVENQYTRSVRSGGNIHAQELITQVFEVVDRKWRGIGGIPQSGLGVRAEYAAWDAEKKFKLEGYTAEESPDCISGLIMQGRKKPSECSAFGTKCTPERPLGAPMVSTEGACAAYYRYRRVAVEVE